jgi:hypothetical protein
MVKAGERRSSGAGLPGSQFGSLGDRMRRRSVIVALVPIFVIALWFLFWFAVPGYTRIDLTEEGRAAKILTAILPDGERVTLTWRNSQFGLDVTEAFFTRSGVLIQDRVTFAAPDGTPPPRVSPKDVDDLFHTGGAFDARGLSRPFTRIVYRIGEIGNPKLQVQNRTIALKKEAGFGGRVILTASRPVVYEILYEDIGNLVNHLGIGLHHRIGLCAGAGRSG